MGDNRKYSDSLFIIFFVLLATFCLISAGIFKDIWL
jgi:hypothetical protein